MSRYRDSAISQRRFFAMTVQDMERQERRAANRAAVAHGEEPHDGCDRCRGWRTPCEWCGLGDTDRRTT